MHTVVRYLLAKYSEKTLLSIRELSGDWREELISGVSTPYHDFAYTTQICKKHI